jgi:hypothetical protein
MNGNNFREREREREKENNFKEEQPLKYKVTAIQLRSRDNCDACKPF